MSQRPTRHIALQFGRIKHFNEGLSEFSRQLAMHLALQAETLKAERGWQFHFVLPPQWHGMFGEHVTYQTLETTMRWMHRFPVHLDVWHGLHQHMRYRAPLNSRSNLITVHDLNHLDSKRGLSLWWQSKRLARQLRQADHIVAISQFVHDDIERRLPQLARSQVIHNGVADLSRMPRTEIPQLAGQPFMLHISRMSASKNVEALIDMMTAWPERKLVLAGPSSQEVERHRSRVEQMGLENVLILADVSEPQKAWLYDNCAAFLFPSLLEGFGLPPIEAMFFGKPVIVSRRTSLPEVCGAAAAYWDDFDPGRMRDVVEAQIDAVARRAGLSATVRNHALNYTWHRAANQYVALYESVLT